MSEENVNTVTVEPNDTDTAINLYGSLEVEGQGSYVCFLKQTRTATVWVLTTQDYISGKQNKEEIEAILRIKNTGKMDGTGKIWLLTRLLDNLNIMVGKCANSAGMKAGFVVTGNYHGEGIDDSFIEFETQFAGTRYKSISLYYEGFRLDVKEFRRQFPVKIPARMVEVSDEKSTAAVIAGLGVRSFALLKRRKGAALDWYNRKRYHLVQTNEEFRAMMLKFLRAVQEAADAGRPVLAALDTETTGLNMFNLQPGNPARDHIVAIPFGWEDDEAYVICTDMHYFNNVDSDEVYPLFDYLFHRNPDYSGHQIDFDYCGEHFNFNRKFIMLVGANVGFDECAFFSEGAHVYFDEDIQVMHYNLATDWVQGKNSLKYMTHRYIGDETLELEELFGAQHKDKYRYLSDKDLALVYGGADADYPRVLWFYLRKMLPDNLYKLYKKYDMTTLYRCSDATWQGMPIDEAKVREQGENVLKDLETLKEFIYRYAYAANRNNLENKAEKLANLLGLDSTPDVQAKGDEEGMYRYKFTPANHKNLLFNILGYPVIKQSETSHEPALDKFVLKKLAEFERETPVEFLTEDIPSVADPSKPLIKKKDFNKLMYPLAIVFQKYAEINKEYTAYYKPIMDSDLESRMFYRFSLQRAATRRILSPGQTMKSSLKKLVIAPPKRLFMCFDASQIEYRHMASLAYIQTKDLLQRQYPNNWEAKLDQAGITRIHKMMQREESDYHIETASMMTGKPQYMVSKDERKMYKSIGFGIPYGLGDRSMCESLFKNVTPELMAKTKEVLDDYKKRQFEIIRMLETVRDSAFVPAEISPEFRRMLDIGDTYVGIVKNFIGFYRLFILEDRTRAKTSRIRRQAGNCVIQGGAAELFRRMIYNFYMGCVKAGIEEQVQWLMLVHDEVDTTVSADVDVCKLIDVLYSSCTLRYEDHIPYYIGIGFGHNWYDAKDDSAELPVIMVDRLVKAYRAGKFSIPCDGNQPENLLKLKRHYMCDRIGEELSTFIDGIGPGFVWTEDLAAKVESEFSNYVVRAYLSVFITKEVKSKYPDGVPMAVQLQCWQTAREEYGFNNDFLTERFVDAREELAALELDGVGDADIGDVDIDELSIDILSNAEDDSDGIEIEGVEGSWFDEHSLFDTSISQEEILADDGSSSSGYRYAKQKKDEEELEYNEAPTNAYDVFVSKTYTRQHVVQSSKGVYTVLLSGTKYHKQVGVIAQAMRQQFGAGTNTYVLIGETVLRLTNLGGTEEQIDNLDKVVSGIK